MPCSFLSTKKLFDSSVGDKHSEKKDSSMTDDEGQWWGYIMQYLLQMTYVWRQLAKHHGLPD